MWYVWLSLFLSILGAIIGIIYKDMWLLIIGISYIIGDIFFILNLQKGLSELGGVEFRFEVFKSIFIILFIALVIRNHFIN